MGWLDKKRPGTVVSAAETEHDASCIPCYKWTGGYNMGEGLGRPTEFDQDRTIKGCAGVTGDTGPTSRWRIQQHRVPQAQETARGPLQQASQRRMNLSLEEQ